MSLVLSISDREILRRRQRSVSGEAYAEAVGRRYLSIFIVLLWGMLCICALFIVSEKFVNPEITPKRFGLVAGACVAAVAWPVCCRRPVAFAGFLLWRGSVLMKAEIRRNGGARYAEAERHFKTAANMCPVRFMPLYEPAKLYDAVGRRDEALATAKKIIDKEVKIPSPTVTAIKNDMRNRLDAKEPITNNPENENRTSDQPKNNGTRQGGTPEAWPRGAALPP